VGLEGPGYRRHREQSISEQRGEDLRLLYVALTGRATRPSVWWTGRRSAASRRSGGWRSSAATTGRSPSRADRVPSDAAAVERFEQLAALSGTPGRIAVERASVGAPRGLSPRRSTRAATSLASRFDRRLDRDWRRTSYSDLTARSHEPRVASEPEEDILGDEPDEGVPAGRGRRRRRWTPRCWAVPGAAVDMPGGTLRRHAGARRPRGGRLRGARTCAPS
jgi:exodeoxyribonuclease V beta subunit